MFILRSLRETHLPVLQIHPFYGMILEPITNTSVDVDAAYADTIEDINGKFVGLNGTLNGKKDNERYTIEHLKYRSVPFNYRSVSFSVIENVNGKCIGLNGKLNGKK